MSATTPTPVSPEISRVPATPRFVVQPEPSPSPRPSWWRSMQQVIDTHQAGRAIVGQYRTWGMADACARALNAGRPLPAETAAERWGWAE